jgi:hypothetical protein
MNQYGVTGVTEIENKIHHYFIFKNGFPLGKIYIFGGHTIHAI